MIKLNIFDNKENCFAEALLLFLSKINIKFYLFITSLNNNESLLAK